MKLGHTVRLIPPAYVKPFLKRQRTMRPMRRRSPRPPRDPRCGFVAVKSEEQQSLAILFRTRQMFVAQRTELINALRGPPCRARPCGAQGHGAPQVLGRCVSEPGCFVARGCARPWDGCIWRRSKDLRLGSQSLIRALRPQPTKRR
jgi:hypothetical protein